MNPEYCIQLCRRSIPTFVLKQTIDLLAPFVAELFNRSLAAGDFHGRFKDAFITPIVKKAGLIPLKPVLTGPSLIFQFYQSSCNDSLFAS